MTIEERIAKLAERVGPMLVQACEDAHRRDFIAAYAKAHCAADFARTAYQAERLLREAELLDARNPDSDFQVEPEMRRRELLKQLSALLDEAEHA